MLLRERAILLVVIGLMMVAGCARSPEVQKVRHLERGEQYFGREQYREAIIEYRNVLRIEQTNVRALRQLGIAHYHLGELGQGFRYLLKSRELTPDDLDVRLKLGTIYLLSSRRDETRGEAAYVLERNPKNLDALLLLAGAAVRPDEVDAALQRLEGAKGALQNRAKFHLAMGTLHFRRRDLASAERAFAEAVVREPNSVEGHIALADLYMVKRDPARAEGEFKAAAAMAPIGSPASIKLADFYLVSGRLDEGTRTLRAIVEKAPGYLPAWRRLAETQLAQGRYDEAEKSLEAVLKKNASDLDGLLLLGRVRLARHQMPEAIQLFQKALTLEPRLAVAHYYLAQAHRLAGNLQQAKAALREATTIASNFTEATLLLAELNIQTGAVGPAIEDLEKLIVRQPEAMQAYLLLGSAYLAKGEPAKATGAYRKMVALAPKDPRGPYFVGLGLRAQGERARAQKEFEASMALAPDYIEPLAQLVSMALVEKQPDLALARVQQQTALAPKSGALQYLLGEVYLALGRGKLAEDAFAKAFHLEPRLVGALVQLGRLYEASGKYDQALVELTEARRVSPGNPVVLTLAGVMYERKGDIPKARDAYEKAVALHPRFAAAANNLAWLYMVHGGDADKERALQLAQTAKEVAPENPRISDTLGWILHQRGVYRNALSLLQESAAKLPADPEVQYHLGMTHYKLGNREAAREALGRALKLRDQFHGADDARRTLAAL
jgi:tetratricopeptide (TPR) repeat protein